MLTGDADATAWWRSPPPSGAHAERELTTEEPMRVLIAGGGLAGLVAAAACHSKGMKVALFEQASSYAPYGGPIQIQSNALRAIERISPAVYEDLVAAGTCTADRVSGLKIGYKRGNKLAGLYARRRPEATGAAPRPRRGSSVGGLRRRRGWEVDVCGDASRRRRGRDVDRPWAYRSDAAAGTWIVRGRIAAPSRLGGGRLWRRVATPPRPGRGSSLGVSRRRRGRDVDFL